MTKCKLRIDKDLARREQLKWAISKWQEAATWGPDGHKESCLRTVESLTLELKTGKPHCNCCMSPDCKFRIKNYVNV